MRESKITQVLYRNPVLRSKQQYVFILNTVKNNPCIWYAVIFSEKEGGDIWKDIKTEREHSENL